MVQISAHALNRMGFSKIDPPLAITARFRRMIMYSIDGINLPDGGIARLSSSIEDLHYSIGFALDPNHICRSLCDDDWVDNVSAWEKENQCKGPYALLVLKLTEPQTDMCTFAMQSETSIEAYDCFNHARGLLDEFEQKLRSTAMSAALVALSKYTEAPLIREVDRVTVGLSTDSKIVRPFNIRGHAELRVNRALRSGQYDTFLDLIERTSKTIPPRCAKFFWLGCNEKDNLKSFIYTFLALEVLTHQYFDCVPNKNTKIRDLSKKFQFCAEHIWADIDQADCAIFSTLKDLRNDIAHGDIEAPDRNHLSLLRTLADKVLYSISSSRRCIQQS